MTEPARDLPDPLPTTDAPRTRRRFLLEASLATALAACGRSEQGGGTEHGTTTNAHGGQQPNAYQPRPGDRNPDSQTDTALHHAMPSATHTDTSAGAASRVTFHRYDPTLPPVSPQRTTRLHFTSRDASIRINDDTVIAAWTFEGDVPGPIVHVRQGDTVEFTLTNRGHIPHSMDFHAAQIDPKTAFRSIMPGDSLSFTFKPKYAGVFLYHCGTAPVLMHLGSGMFGALVVDPPTPLRTAKEFVLVQNEYYLGTPQNGIAPLDYNKMLVTLPDLFAFNGRPSQYDAAPIHVTQGDLVRFYIANAGPTHSCSFHIVGEQFDTVYLGAPPANAMHGVQTFDVAPGGGMIFELKADVAGEFVFVNHSFGHGQKGALGRLIVDRA